MFKKDGTYTLTLAFGSGDGKWEFASSETHIIQDKGTTEETDFEVTKLNESSFEVSQKDGSITTTLKFTKK